MTNGRGGKDRKIHTARHVSLQRMSLKSSKEGHLHVVDARQGGIITFEKYTRTDDITIRQYATALSY